MFFLQKSSILSVVIALAMTMSCKRAEPLDDSGSYACTTSAPSTNMSIGQDSSTDKGPVTYWADIFPILDSSATGHVYKCNVCHANYARPDGLSSVPELTRIVTSMRNGRMPRGGDRVPEPAIQLFEKWRADGFQSGIQGSPQSNRSKRATGIDGNSQGTAAAQNCVN